MDNTEPEIKKAAHFLKTYVTIAEYAALKGVARGNVQKAIKAGKIKAEHVGYHAREYIDLRKYKNVRFKPVTGRVEQPIHLSTKKT